MSAVDSTKLDRSVYEVIPLDTVQEGPGSDREYWRRKTPQERMEALELLRQIIYGYDPATTRLQRVLEIVELKQR
jgi:hypothetical protein